MSFQGEGSGKDRGSQTEEDKQRHSKPIGESMGGNQQHNNKYKINSNKQKVHKSKRRRRNRRQQRKLKQRNHGKATENMNRKSMKTHNRE